MKTYNDVDFYLEMRKKYSKEKLDVIDALWVKASSKLSEIGQTVYTQEGQDLIAGDYHNHFKY